MTRLRRHSHSALFPRARTFVYLGLLSLAFVIYGSLAPFDFSGLPFDKAVTQFQIILDRPLRFTSRSDLVANVLLMVPASFFLMGAVGLDRSRKLALGDAILVLPVCLATSVGVEFAQLWLPNRTCALEDIVAQIGGSLLGGLLWVAVGQLATDWLRWVWKPSEDVGLDARLLPAYLFLLAFVHLVPFDLSPSPVDLYRKFKHGMINLTPFLNLTKDHFSYLEGRIIAGLYFFLLGLLLPGLPWSFWRDWRELGKVLASSLVLVTAITGLKLFVASRGFDITDVVVGTLAAVLGWYISLGVRYAAAQETRRWVVRIGGWVGLLVWGSLITFVTWQPFDWDVSLGAERWHTLPLIPFVDVLRGDELNAFGSLMQKLVLYLPLGALVTTWRPTPCRFAWVPALLCGVLVAGSLEVGQLFLASRTATLTDVYVQTLGAVLGSVIVRQLCVVERTAVPVELPSELHPLVAEGKLVW